MFYQYVVLDINKPDYYYYYKYFDCFYDWPYLLLFQDLIAVSLEQALFSGMESIELKKKKNTQHLGSANPNY